MLAGLRGKAGGWWWTESAVCWDEQQDSTADSCEGKMAVGPMSKGGTSGPVRLWWRCWDGGRVNLNLKCITRFEALFLYSYSRQCCHKER